MFLKRYLALTAACAVVALLLLTVPASAEGRGGSRGGFYSGYGGGYNSWRGGTSYRGGYYGAYGGGTSYRGGFYPGYGGYSLGYSSGYYGGYSPGYNSGYYGGYSPGISIGVGAYPYNNYYSPSVVQYSSPSYYVTPRRVVVPAAAYDENISGYAEPVAPDTRSTVEVLVPNSTAQVFFNGDPTQQTGTDRTFQSPPLTPGKNFTYTVEARWMENGRMVDQSRSVTVSAGQKATVDFTR